MPHALFVAFHYPPEASSSGVLRTLKFSRYLGEFGWRVTVLAPQPDAYSIVDSKLEAQIPASVRVVRTRWFNTKRHFSIAGRYPALAALPDTWIGWLPWAVAAGRRVLREDPADLVYSTSPHATAHLIALRLTRSGRLPWVIDFRDPWIEDPPEPGTPNGLVFRNVNRRLEKRVVEHCAQVVTSTNHLRDLLQARYPGVAPEKFTAILNGYDEADFAQMPDAPAVRREQFLIVHAGSINADFRDPRPLFRAVREAIDAGRIEEDRIRLRFIGGGEFGESAAIRQSLADCGLREQIEFAGRVPYDAALRELAQADMLLLLQASDDTVGLVPAKLYEYLRSQRPVLALVRPGATSEVLAQTGGGWTVDPRDKAALMEAVAVAYSAWKTGELSNHCADLKALRAFDRRTLAQQLAAVFDRACGST